jgi:hypothetical protein
MLLAQRCTFRHSGAMSALMGARIQEHAFDDFAADTRIGIPPAARWAREADSLQAFALVVRTLDDNAAITATAA